MIAEVRMSFLLIRTLKRLVRKRKYKKNIFHKKMYPEVGFELLPTKNILHSRFGCSIHRATANHGPSPVIYPLKLKTYHKTCYNVKLKTVIKHNL